MDPRQLKRLMDSMGIRSREVEAQRVIIEGRDMDIIIENPQVTAIDAQGSRSFQITGDAKEVAKVRAEIDEDDVKLVMEQSGTGDEAGARKALEESGGDIAAAILKLKGGE